MANYPLPWGTPHYAPKATQDPVISIIDMYHTIQKERPKNGVCKKGLVTSRSPYSKRWPRLYPPSHRILDLENIPPDIMLSNTYSRDDTLRVLHLIKSKPEDRVLNFYDKKLPKPISLANYKKLQVNLTNMLHFCSAWSANLSPNEAERTRQVSTTWSVLCIFCLLGQYTVYSAPSKQSIHFCVT